MASLPSDIFLLTAAEVSKALRVSVDTIYRLAREGQLPGVWIGRLVRFRPNQVAEFMDQHNEKKMITIKTTTKT